MSHLLHEPFLAQARNAPHAPAIVQGKRRVTYGELDHLSHALSERLAQRGVGVGDRVALLVPKSMESIVAVFAILRSGAAYVPIDEQSPPKRQAGVLRDGAVRGIVATPSAAAKLSDNADDIGPIGFVLDVDGHDLDVGWGRGAPGASPSSHGSLSPSGRTPSVTPSDPAYLLYTSGSSGVPKGVVVSHQAARAFVDWARRTFAIGSDDRLASVAQLNFDLSVFDIFAGLSAGAAVHLVESSLLLRPTRLVAWLQSEKITTWYSVPSTLVLLLEDGNLERTGPFSLERVLFAGEVFPLPPLRRLVRALPHTKFFNLYGPTETNVCTYYQLPAVPDADAVAIPIGYPCDHAHIEIRDADGQLVADGGEGELCVGGPGLMSAYWRQKSLTSQAFWPERQDGPGPLYRTGDRARRDAQGRLWFLGRRDRQVKHRGYRIELGEVETAVASVPGVRESAVITRPDGRGGLGLCALVVPQAGERVTVLTVKSHCGTLLPPYMVPAFVEVRASLPRTSTGKLDLLRLR